MTKFIYPAALLALLFTGSCTQYQAQGAGIGALGGAAIGALAGDDSRDVARGAVIGAAVGTGVAAVQENERRKAEADARYYDTHGGYGAPPAPSQGGGGRQDYPYAERTGNPNRVISPYGPNYNVIDVTGFRSGQLARDPSNNKIFRVP